MTVSYGSDQALAPFLRSIEHASVAPVVVVVADNLAGVGDAERIAHESGARYLPLPQNLGYGGAMNAAIESLPPGNEYVLISNPDVVLHPGAIDRLVETIESDSKIASVGPAIRNEDGSSYPSARTVPGIRNGVGHALFGTVWPGNPWTTAYHASNGKDSARDAGWLSGACLLVRRDAFDAIGGFDDGFFMYFEDVDLGYRFGRAGWRNLYEPGAEVTHSGAHSTSEASDAMAREHHRSAARFLSKKYASPWLAPIRVTLLAGLRFRALMVTRRTRRKG